MVIAHRRIGSVKRFHQLRAKIGRRVRALDCLLDSEISCMFRSSEMAILPSDRSHHSFSSLSDVSNKVTNDIPYHTHVYTIIEW